MVEVKVAGRRSRSPRDGLQSTNLTRDLRAIAELIELCFGKRLDSGDRAAVREMRAVGSLGPLLWLVDAFDTSGLGLGYVWLDDGRELVHATFSNHPDWRMEKLDPAGSRLAQSFPLRVAAGAKFATRMPSLSTTGPSIERKGRYSPKGTRFDLS